MGIVLVLVLLVLVTLENKVNSNSDQFKFVQVEFQVGLRPIDSFRNIKLGGVVLLVLVLVLLVLVTLENKVNSEPDLFKFVQVRSGWVPSRVGV